MPSTARHHQLKDSLFYHIFNRGHSRRDIFHDEQDYKYFKKLLSRYSSTSKIFIYHWVLMPNHYHLLCEINPPENISSIMAGIARSYVYYYHNRYETCGFLWQGRFKSQPVQKEQYFFVCARYIERNPVNAGFVDSAQDYPYSSAVRYIKGIPDGLTYQNPFFRYFGNTEKKQQQSYKKFLQAFNADEDELFSKVEKPVGSKDFCKRLYKSGRLFLPRRKGRLQR